MCDERRDLEKRRYEALSKGIQGSLREDLKGGEESKEGLDRVSVRGDRNLPEQKHQAESKPARAGSSFRETE